MTPPKSTVQTVLSLIALFWVLIFVSMPSGAQPIPLLPPVSSPISASTPTDYYSLDDHGVASPLPAKLQTPLDIALWLEDEIDASTAAALTYSLLDWVHHEEPPPAPPTPFQRTRHFGTWVNDPTDNTCFNTRTKVLIRDSKVQVQFNQKNRCAVESGEWQDPYTGQVFVSAKDLQIDHVVPLKNSYVSGAFKWQPQQRCLYANFQFNNHHLLTVMGTENMKKGSRTPVDYMPPDEKVACEYLQYWLKIKMVWGLIMTAEEASGIQELAQSQHCDPQLMKISQKELKENRAALSNWGGCSNFHGSVPKSEEGS